MKNYKSSKYYFSRLSDAEKDMYNSIETALDDFKPSASVRVGLTKTLSININKTISAVLYDNPAYFYVDKSMVSIMQIPMFFQFNFRYDYTRDEAEKLNAEIHRKASEFLQKYIKPGMDDLTKQRAVYRYLQSEVAPKYANTGKDSFSIIGALIRGSCVCEGMSKTYKLLCDYVQIPSIIVTGEGIRENRPEPHAWNITRINGITAHCDITWDTISGAGAYDYFNLSDSEISADHSFDSTVYPKCEPNKINYFVANNMIASDETEARKIIAANKHKKCFSIRCLFPVTLEKAMNLGFSSGTLRVNERQNVVMFKK